LTFEVATLLQLDMDGMDTNESMLPPEHTKTDSQSPSLRFL